MPKQHDTIKNYPQITYMTVNLVSVTITTLTLEFGYDVEQMRDPFAIERIHKDDTEHASESAFIHPVIRRFFGSTLVAEHHVIEDLAGEWLEDIHSQPLQAFLQNHLFIKIPLSAVELETAVVV
jgi:hypothetical protein